MSSPTKTTTSRRGALGGSTSRSETDRTRSLTRSQYSGAGRRSISRRRSLRSSMLVLQQFREAPATTMKMDADGRGGYAEDRRDLLDGPIRLVVQNDGSPLVGGEVRERLGDIDGPVVVLGRNSLGELRRRPPPPLQLAGGESERHAPDPGALIVDGLTTTKGLGERLGRGVAGDVLITRVGEQ